MKNREIKFRTPNFSIKENGKFSHFNYWGTITYNGKPSLDGGCFTSPGSSSGYTKGWHEQYTGLTDKNGKEIYEGDIICDFEYKDHIGDIQFSHGVFGAEWVDSKKTKSMIGGWGQLHNLRRLDDDLLERLEVIGNIYENPDLIK